MSKEVKLEKYVPDYYDGIRDMKELMRTENPLFKDGDLHYNDLSKINSLCSAIFRLYKNMRRCLAY